MSYKSELIRKLFSDRLKKDELKDLSEIDMIERKMKVQWEEQNPIAENSERVMKHPAKSFTNNLTLLNLIVYRLMVYYLFLRIEMQI